MEKRITCKTCRNPLFRTSDEIVTLWVSLPDLQSHFFCVMCTSCTNKRRGQLFICISCGCMNSRSAKMLKHNGCTCFDALDPVCSPANIQPAGDFCIMRDLTIQCERPDPADDLMTQIQFAEEGWELEQDHEGMDTEQYEDNIFKMPTSFVAEKFFTKENNWPATSQIFLINEHNDRSGLKGTVFQVMIDHNRKPNFDSLSEEEMYFHLLSAIIHYNSSQNESINICSMLEHTTIREDELLDSTKNILFLSGETSPHCPGCYSP